MHWVILYNDVLTEMFGDDKQDAMKVIDNDSAFDSWLKRYSAKQKTSSKVSKAGKQRVSQEDYYNKMAGTFPKPGRRKKDAGNIDTKD